MEGVEDASEEDELEEDPSGAGTSEEDAFDEDASEADASELDAFDEDDAVVVAAAALWDDRAGSLPEASCT